MNEYKIRKAVITGGSGGVGIALIQKLISENVEVVVFQRKDSKRKNNLPKHKLLKIEYCSLEELKDYCPKETGYDVFFHLGWANTQRAMRNNIDEQNKNVIIHAMRLRLRIKWGVILLLEQEVRRNMEGVRKHSVQILCVDQKLLMAS